MNYNEQTKEKNELPRRPRYREIEMGGRWGIVKDGRDMAKMYKKTLHVGGKENYSITLKEG